MRSANDGGGHSFDGSPLRGFFAAAGSAGASAGRRGGGEAVREKRQGRSSQGEEAGEKQPGRTGGEKQLGRGGGGEAVREKSRGEKNGEKKPGEAKGGAPHAGSTARRSKKRGNFKERGVVHLKMFLYTERIIDRGAGERQEEAAGDGRGRFPDTEKRLFQSREGPACLPAE